MNEERCVDVVVDVNAARLERPFTYLLGDEPAGVGARVRVPFGERMVGGWVVSAPHPAPSDGATLRAIDGVDAEAAALGVAAVRLAEFIHRRYACSFREAILAVAARDTPRSANAAYAFIGEPAADDATARALRSRFAERRFTAVAARRALRASGKRLPLAVVSREIDRLVRAAVVGRIERRSHAPVAPRRVRVIARAPSGPEPRSAAQRRLLEALDAAGSPLTVSALSEAAGTTTATIRRALEAGILIAVAAVPDAKTTSSALVPTEDQTRAIAAIGQVAREGGGTVLLQGITGSGKTLVYARSVEAVRARGGKAIVLVPEIALTPQTAARFEALYGARVGVLHSGLSDGERARVWEDAKRGDVDVVVGARSAVFAPMPDIELIVVDEEHEPSYKQDVAPRYDTAVVAQERMREVGGVVVLGSATPSLESYRAALDGAIAHIRLDARATRAPLPPVEIVDMTGQGATRRGILSPPLVAAMERAFARGEKSLLFVNRRGYAGLLLCRACGFAPKCRRCAISLVVHLVDGSMRCHVCAAAYRMPSRCPKCSSEDLKPFGFGTQRVEEEMQALFPDAAVVRMDADTTSRRGSHGTLLSTFGERADVLIGTQMIAKGLDFPTVTVVGVVSADIDLHRPDFRAAERSFALLTQVAGRAGRAGPGARVIVQTYAPDHYAIRHAAKHDYDAFATAELALRRELRYPPYGRLTYLSIAGADAEAVSASAAAIAEAIRRSGIAVEVLGPAPEPLPKARGEYRMRVALKSETLEPMLDACAAAKEVRLGRDVRCAPIVDPR